MPDPAVNVPAASRGLSVLEAGACILLMFAIGFACADVFVGPWDHDGGFYLLHSWYVSQGMVPYIDYPYIYPPLMDVLTAFLVALPIERLVLAVAIPILWILANTLATGLIVFTATKDRLVSILIAALYPVFSIQNGGNHLTLEHGVSLFSALTFVLLLGDRPLSVRRAALVGLLFAAACLSKQNGVVALLVVAAAAFHRRTELTRRHLLAFLGGGAALPLVLLVWLRFDVAAIYNNLIGKLVTYAGASQSSDGWKLEALRAPESVAIMVAAALCAVIAFAMRPAVRLIAIAAVAGAILQFLPRLVRDYTHYNLNMWPFLALALALGLASIPAKNRAALLIVLVCVIPMLIAGAAHRFPPLFPRIAVFYAAAEQIRRVTPPNAVVRQYGSEPILEFLSETYEEQIARPDAVMANWDGSGIYSTVPAPSTTVVIVDDDQPWLGTVRAQLREWGFERVSAVGLVSIYRRRG